MNPQLFIPILFLIILIFLYNRYLNKYIYPLIKLRDGLLQLLTYLVILISLGAIFSIKFESISSIFQGIFGLYSIILSIGLLRLKKWSWYLSIISLLLFIVSTIIISFFSSPRFPQEPSFLALFLPYLIIVIPVIILLYRRRAWFNIQNIKPEELEKSLSSYNNAKEAALSLSLYEKDFDAICYNLGYLPPWEEEMIRDAIKNNNNSRSAAKQLKTKVVIFETICREFGIEIPWKKS